MTKKENDQCLDVSRISFPGDRVTLGQLRSEQPNEFGNPEFSNWRIDQIEAMHMLYDQVILARKAYARTIGRQDPYPDESREELYSKLNRDYKRYGISKGMQSTRVLLRGIEQAAEEQAKLHRGLMR